MSLINSSDRLMRKWPQKRRPTRQNGTMPGLCFRWETRRPHGAGRSIDRDVSDKGKVNSKEVFDSLIASLRHEYIQEVKKSGKEGGLAPQIEEALKSAWDLRTSFVYIRPAGAYLRSSYPTTSLQDDPALALE